MLNIRIPYIDVYKLVADRIAKNDKAHQKPHVDAVYELAIELMLKLQWDVNPDIVILAVAYHDAACHMDRGMHHFIAADVLEEDTPQLLELGYTLDEIAHAKECVIAHRSSWDGERKTLECRLTAMADRGLVFRDLDDAVLRAYQYGVCNHELEGDAGMTRARLHIAEKYGRDTNRIDPVVYELFKSEWEAMFDILSAWVATSSRERCREHADKFWVDDTSPEYREA